MCCATPASFCAECTIIFAHLTKESTQQSVLGQYSFTQEAIHLTPSAEMQRMGILCRPKASGCAGGFGLQEKGPGSAKTGGAGALSNTLTDIRISKKLLRDTIKTHVEAFVLSKAHWQAREPRFIYQNILL